MLLLQNNLSGSYLPIDTEHLNSRMQILSIYMLIKLYSIVVSGGHPGRDRGKSTDGATVDVLFYFGKANKHFEGIHDLKRSCGCS